MEPVTYFTSMCILTCIEHVTFDLTEAEGSFYTD